MRTEVVVEGKLIALMQVKSTDDTSLCLEEYLSLEGLGTQQVAFMVVGVGASSKLAESICQDSVSLASSRKLGSD